MSSDKEISPEGTYEENPEWTRGDMNRAHPAMDVLSRHVGSAATGELLRRTRGRPLNNERKVNQTLRIDPDVLEAYKRIGKGWQTHINSILRANMPEHRK